MVNETTAQQVGALAAKPGDLRSIHDKKLSDLHNYSGMHILKYIIS